MPTRANDPTRSAVPRRSRAPQPPGGGGRVGAGRDTDPPALNPSMCAALLHDPGLPQLLASPRDLAAAMRRWGYEVPHLPAPIRHLGPSLTTLLTLARTQPRVTPAPAPALWPAQGLPAWLPGLLDPKTPPLVQQLIADLVAAHAEATLCWGAGIPTRRQHRARARALRRAADAVRATDARAVPAPGQAWWQPGWNPPCGLLHRLPEAELLTWFVRHVRRTLQGQVSSPARQRPPQPSAPGTAVVPAAPPRSRRLALRQSPRPGTTPPVRRRR
jgi:hypothetical protein